MKDISPNRGFEYQGWGNDMPLHHNLWYRFNGFKVRGTPRHAIIEKFGNKCGICGKVPQKPFVDHDHVTGQIRGILCSECNRGLGGFKDNTWTMEKAIQYIRRTRENA